MSEKKTNKTTEVLKHLQTYGYITSLEAIEKYIEESNYGSIKELVE